MADAADGFLIWGAGGHGRVVAELVRAVGYTVVGFIDQDPDRAGVGCDRHGVRVVRAEAPFVAALRAGRGLPPGVCAVALGIGRNETRLTRRRELRQPTLPPLVHPTAVTSPTARLGAGAVVLPRAVVNTGAWIGDAVIVNTGAIVEHDCVLEDGAHVSPGAVLAGGVRVGARAWIGAGAVVIEGLRVGADAVVGAGAVIIDDVPDGATVVGNPGRIVQRRAAALQGRAVHGFGRQRMPPRSS